MTPERTTPKTEVVPVFRKNPKSDKGVVTETRRVHQADKEDKFPSHKPSSVPEKYLSIVIENRKCPRVDKEVKVPAPKPSIVPIKTSDDSSVSSGTLFDEYGNKDKIAPKNTEASYDDLVYQENKAESSDVVQQNSEISKMLSMSSKNYILNKC